MAFGAMGEVVASARVVLEEDDGDEVRTEIG